MIKRILLSSLALISTITLSAQNQTIYDALMASSTELHGTARFVGLGGAMGALGGNASTLHYNPGGIGVYKSSELTITGNINWDNTTMGANNTSSLVSATLENATYIGTWSTKREKGLISMNFGVGYNRSKTFNRAGSYNQSQDYSVTQWLSAYTNGIQENDMSKSSSYDPWKNPNVGWRSILACQSHMFNPAGAGNNYTSAYDLLGGGMVTNNVNFTEYGSINDFTLSTGGNVDNIFYWGMSFVCNYINYSKYTNYQEIMPNGHSLSINNKYLVEGSGFTYKLGFIVKPVEWLRIGGAYHTPTWYALTDYANADYAFTDNSGTNRNQSTPYTSNGFFYVNSPMKALGSLGFVISKYALIGIDYEYANYNGITMQSAGRVNMVDANNAAKQELLDTHTIRAGVEVKPIKQLSLRVGGNYSTASINNDAQRMYYNNDVRTDTDYYNNQGYWAVTAGVGYFWGRHSIDLAYIYQQNIASYNSFSPTYQAESGDSFAPANYSAVNMRSIRNQILLTYSIRF